MVKRIRAALHPLRSNQSAQMIGDTSLLMLSQYVAAGLSFLSSALAARLLGPDQFGYVALAVSFPGLMWSLVGVKTSTVTLRYLARFRSRGNFQEANEIALLGYATDAVLCAGSTLLVVGTAVPISRILYDRPGVAGLMILYAAFFPLLSFRETSTATLFAWERFRPLAVSNLLEHVVTIAILVLSWRTGISTTKVVLAMTLGQTAKSILLTVCALRVRRSEGFAFAWMNPMKAAHSFRKELTALFGWNYLIITLNGLVVQGPVMILGAVATPREAGFFRLANSLATAAGYPEITLAKVMQSKLSVLNDKSSAVRHLIRRWTMRAGFPAAAFVLLMALCLPIAISVLFGHKYDPMISGAQLMLLGVAVSTLLFWLNSYFYSFTRLAEWAGGQAAYTGTVLVVVAIAAGAGTFIQIAAGVAISRMVFASVMAARVIHRLNGNGTSRG